jgi:hypothetical protein
MVDLGRVWTSPQITQIELFLMPLQWSQWEKGNKAQVWHSSWINGTAPTDLAPSLYVKTKRKNISVLKALSNNAWVAHISPLGNGTEIQEYVALWEMINSIVRDEEADDQIIYGGGPQMENIQRAAHIAFSSRASSKKGQPLLSGMQKPNQNARFLHGSYFNVRYSQQSILRNEDGQMTQYVNYATPYPKRRTTFARTVHLLV